MTVEKPVYRQDIDGLRAISVAAVVAFHLQAPFASGGFIGVDVFFVISGYLITGILYREQQKGKLSLASFFERRVRRIFPALFVMLGVTSLVAAFVLLPPDFESFCKSLGAASLSVANIHLYSEAGYFNEASELKPLLHTWSLAVEEQFYLLWPLLLIVLRKWSRLGLIAGVGVLWLASFAANVIWLEGLPDAVFYLLPFRAWELLTGSLLALGSASLPVTRWSNWIGLVGLLLIGSSAALLDSSGSFPGWAALLPNAGAAMVIYGGSLPNGLVSRILSLRPLVYLGRVSYSLYLWHWPLWSLLVYYSPNPITAPQRVGVAVASLISAALSWRFVEQPFRGHEAAPTNRVRVFGGAVTVIAFACVAAALGIVSEGWPGRFAPHVQRYARLLDKEQYFSSYDRGGCFLDYDQGARDYDTKKCAAFSSRDKTRVLLFGDSYAANLYPGLTAVPDLEVRQLTATSCRPLTGESRRCTDIQEHFFRKVLKRSTADVVVVSGFWDGRYEPLGRRLFEQRLTQMLTRLRRSGKVVVLVGQTPIFHKPVALTLAMRSRLHAQELHGASLRPRDAKALNASLKRVAKACKVRFFDPYAAACRGKECPVVKNQEVFHWDTGHMTEQGSRYYARKLESLLHARQSPHTR
jgi:peptidoglycan/LPS O-acetylase OafA/YrhL